MQDIQLSLGPSSALPRTLALAAALVALGAPGQAPAWAQAAGAVPRPAARAPSDVGVSWQRSRAFAGVALAHAVAVDVTGTRVAAGDDDGAWLVVDGEPVQRLGAPGPIRDLAFAPDGTLWIAGDEGLFAFDPAGRLHERTPVAGEEERQVRRVVAAAGLVLCGTAAGAFASRDGHRWVRLDGGIPDGEVTALAIGGAMAGPAGEASPGPLDLWLVVDGDVLRARLRIHPELEARQVARPPLPPSALPALDLLGALPDAEIALLGESSLFWLRGDRWEAQRTELPAGAIARRLALLAGRLWIATDAGLLEEREGRFARALGPAGAEAVGAVAGTGDRLYAAGELGVLVASVEQAAAPAHAGLEAPPDLAAGEPDVRTVQRATLRYLDLHPSRVAAMRRNLGLSGWLPTLRVTGNHGGRRFLRQDWDEAFTGGDYRFLFDRTLDRTRDFSSQVQLTWDLGNLAYHPRTVELSRESRELTRLRDQVLSQVVQLYFARRRVLLDLAALDGPAGLEAERLRLRADELAAGLDAWTGGWWSGQVAPLSRRTDRAPGSRASAAGSGPR